MDSLRINTLPHPVPTFVALQLDGQTPTSEILRAMRMIRGVEYAREIKGPELVTPALRRHIARAEKNFREGKTVKFHTVEEMDAYLDTL